MSWTCVGQEQCPCVGCQLARETAEADYWRRVERAALVFRGTSTLDIETVIVDARRFVDAIDAARAKGEGP